MMRFYIKTLPATIAIILPLLAQGVEKTFYANKANAKVFAEKSMGSKVIATLKLGESLQADDTSTGLFRQVKTMSGQIGFVPYTFLTDKIDSSASKVSSMVRNLTKPKEEQPGESRSRTANAVMGIRGLVPSEKDALNVVSKTKPDLKLVYQLEEQQISAASINKLSEELFQEMDSPSQK